DAPFAAAAEIRLDRHLGARITRRHDVDDEGPAFAFRGLVSHQQAALAAGCDHHLFGLVGERTGEGFERDLAGIEVPDPGALAKLAVLARADAGQELAVARDALQTGGKTLGPRGLRAVLGVDRHEALRAGLLTPGKGVVGDPGRLAVGREEHGMAPLELARRELLAAGRLPAMENLARLVLVPALVFHGNQSLAAVGEGQMIDGTFADEGQGGLLP